MKQIHYHGSSKLISRIVYLLNRKAPLPLDGDGDPDWGTNGQVLTTDGSGNTSWTSGGGSGGHTIQDNGTDMISRTKLDFVGATVTDNAVNDATVVEFSQAQADWNEADNTKADYIKNKPTIPAAQIQSDWNQSDSSALDYIKNKPSIPSGGDTVSWTQIQQSGTKIAEIDINGSTQDVYAPNGGGSTYTAGDGINISAQNAISVDTVFTEAATRANIASGDTFATILGKVKKFFSDLKTVAFTGSYSDLTGQPTIPTDFVSKANGGTFGGNISVDGKNGTTSAYGISYLTLGNNKPLGTDKNSFGAIRFYGGSSFHTDMSGVNSTGNRTIILPDADGTIALTSSAVGGLLVESFTATSLSSGFVNVSKTGYKPVFAMVTNLPALVACRGIMYDGSTYYLRLEQWDANQNWTAYTTSISCNIVAGYVPN